MKITTIISFCTHDFRFLRKCLEEVAPFSHQILVTCCDHFFSGEQENYALLQHAYRAHPEVTFLQFSFHTCYTPLHLDCKEEEKRHYWHNIGRYLAYYYLDVETTHLFFFDVDEIAEGKRLSEWLKAGQIERFSALRFSSYWYFREARYRATQLRDSALLVKRDALKPEMLLDLNERMGILSLLPGDNWQGVQDEKPFIHHYTFVRTQEEMLHKVQRWGHHWERKWPELIEQEFARSFEGVDFIAGYRYEPVPAFFDPLTEAVPTPNVPMGLEAHNAAVHRLPHVIAVSASDVFKRDLHKRFEILC